MEWICCTIQLLHNHNAMLLCFEMIWHEMLGIMVDLLLLRSVNSLSLTCNLVQCFLLAILHHSFLKDSNVLKMTINLNLTCCNGLKVRIFLQHPWRNPFRDILLFSLFRGFMRWALVSSMYPAKNTCFYQMGDLLV